jgi:hypothetical protein
MEKQLPLPFAWIIGMVQFAFALLGLHARQASRPLLRAKAMADGALHADAASWCALAAWPSSGDQENEAVGMRPSLIAEKGAP